MLYYNIKTSGWYLVKRERTNEEILEYYNIACGGDYPKFIDKYIKTNELERLDGIGQFCGCDYTKVHSVKYWYTRLDHSIITALMTWHFTKDKAQTLAALFHDLGTPAFSHCIDFFLGDSIKQESSEISVKDILSNSQEICDYLEKDQITLDLVSDIETYTIVDNERPKICVDRLDGVLHTGLIWLHFWSIEDIKEIYNDMAVFTNNQNELELGFNNINIAEKFYEGAYKYSIALQSNEDKYTLSFIADILKNMVKSGLDIESLYKLSELEIVNMIEKSDNNNDWRIFSNREKIIRSDTVPNVPHYKLASAKKRYVIPLCKNNNKLTRLNEISDRCQELLDDYSNFVDSKYILK